MANLNAPFGFKPLRHLTGGKIKTNEYEMASGLASTIGLGDVVVLLTTGLIDRAAAGDLNNVGVFAGCQYIAVDGSVVFNKIWTTGTVAKTGTKIRCWVYDDPYLTFMVQTSGATAFTKDMIGANCDIVATAANTSTGMSAEDLLITTPVATTAGVKIMRFLDGIPGNQLLANAKVEVVFYEHIYGATVGI